MVFIPLPFQCQKLSNHPSSNLMNGQKEVNGRMKKKELCIEYEKTKLPNNIANKYKMVETIWLLFDVTLYYTPVKGVLSLKPKTPKKKKKKKENKIGIYWL